MEAFQYLKGPIRKVGMDFFSRACCDMTGDYGFILKGS